MSDVRVNGPIFDDPDMFVKACMEIRDELAAYAVASVHDTLNARIIHPTPYYETQIDSRAINPFTRTVDDRGVIYGPWLEGVSHRNQVTGFKGYHAFRIAREKVSAVTDDVIKRVIGKYL